MISYKPFYKTLSKKKITQYQLMKDYFIPAGTIDRIRKNKSITLTSIEFLCKAMKCNIDEIVAFI